MANYYFVNTPQYHRRRRQKRTNNIDGVLRRMAPLVGASILKTSLLINELTCLIGNVMQLVVPCCLSDACPRSVHACDSIGGNGLCVRSPRVPVRAHALRAI